ncbi:MAG: lycopene cyclase domain-containing protein [Bacteroidota bacterium]|nr:lycopene cyclase domain-containing protein [Bacteroidota bacterium]
MYLYLLIDFCAVIIPFLFSFHSKLQFHKEWKWFFPANIVVAAIFIVWDSQFTAMGVWGFNPDYVTGIRLFGLPIEEILFFICIPYSSLFTLHALKKVFDDFGIDDHARDGITYFLIGACFLLGFIFLSKWYTTTAFFAAAISLLIAKFYLKEKIDLFYQMFGMILIPFFIVNGILTGSWIPGEVVWYNDAENLGIRMWTIPIEDTFYGLALLLLNYIGMEMMKSTFVRRDSSIVGNQSSVISRE